MQEKNYFRTTITSVMVGLTRVYSVYFHSLKPNQQPASQPTNQEAKGRVSRKRKTSYLPRLNHYCVQKAE
jgi:hypothetical protein